MTMLHFDLSSILLVMKKAIKHFLYIPSSFFSLLVSIEFFFFFYNKLGIVFYCIYREQA